MFQQNTFHSRWLFILDVFYQTVVYSRCLEYRVLEGNCLLQLLEQRVLADNCLLQLLQQLVLADNCLFQFLEQRVLADTCLFQLLKQRVLADSCLFQVVRIAYSSKQLFIRGDQNIVFQQTFFSGQLACFSRQMFFSRWLEQHVLADNCLLYVANIACSRRQLLQDR